MGAVDVEFVVGAQVDEETRERGNEEASHRRLLVSACTRVLLIDHADFLGGAERNALELLASMDRTKFDVILACAPGAVMDAARTRGICIAPLSLPQVRGRRNVWSAPFKLAACVGNLVRLIHRERIAIVHSNTMRATVFAAPAAWLVGTKFVWHVHDLHRERVYLWLMSKFAHAIIANSRAVAQTIPHFAQRKTTVVYNGVILRDFNPARADRAVFRAELGLRDEHLLIGNVGWFAPWKGQHEFVEAAARIASQCAHARFVVVGAASDERHHEYERAVREHGDRLLGDKIFWAGERQSIQPVLAALDLLLHCADHEPFGRVLIEAMALRVPVVAFGGGGPDEIIAHGQSGLLVAPHDVDALARAVMPLRVDSIMRQTMGDAARARVEALFDSETNTRRIEAIYQSLRPRPS